MYPDNTSRSETLYERALKVMPGGNSRHTVYFPPYPLYAARGAGSKVTDVDGVERLDFINNYSSLIHGHCHPEVTAAIVRQAQTLTAAALPTEAEVELAELLTRRIPSVEQVRFANSGTEGVMMALKAARGFTGRRVIAKIEGAYHGSDDTAAVSTAPDPGRWGDPDAPMSVPEPGSGPGVGADVIVLQLNDVEAGRARLQAVGADLAAVLVDPLVSNIGYQHASTPFLKMLREETRALGALLIFDEVYSLRLGFGGAQETLGISPDLTAMGKIIGGGLPVGAVGGRADIMCAVFDPRPGKAKVAHGGTYNANPLTMTAGAVSMRLFDESAFNQVSRLGERLRAGLAEAVKIAGAEASVRGAASLAGLFHLRPAGDTYRALVAARTARPDSASRAAAFFRHMLNNGILMGATGTFVLSTAHTEGDVDRVVDQTLRALRTIDQIAA